MGPKPPGPRGEPLFGSGRRYADDPSRFLSACERAYGDIARFGPGPSLTMRPADGMPMQLRER